MMAGFKVGDWVVYEKQKHGTCPGRRAKVVHPSEHGETYSYIVEKFWIVAKDCGDGTLELLTRRGKRHQVAIGDCHLRLANWWERFWHRQRFPQPPQNPVHLQHSS